MPAEAETLKAGWTGYLLALSAACDHLRAIGAPVRFCPAEGLAQDGAALDLLEWLTGARPSALWLKGKQRLRVTSGVSLGECAIIPPARAMVSVDLPGLDSFDTAGLSAAVYRRQDFPIIAKWWEEHTGKPMAEAALPPLGVVVSNGAGPLAAVWCYESYGVPVAELVFPVTRPGLNATKAAAALCYGVAACVHAAGQGHQPRAEFRLFKVFAPKAMTRALEKLGFQHSLTERVAMTLSL